MYVVFVHSPEDRLNAVIARLRATWVSIAASAAIIGCWSMMDTSPLTFRILPVTVADGVVVSSSPFTGNPSDGSTNVYTYVFTDRGGVRHIGRFWAPTSDSKPGIFWKPFPLLPAGNPVKVEYLRWSPTCSRISGMRRINLSFDGALFAAFIALVAVFAISRMMRGSRLYVNSQP